jgi:excisionase family DNA binding protein
MNYLHMDGNRHAGIVSKIAVSIRTAKGWPSECRQERYPEASNFDCFRRWCWLSTRRRNSGLVVVCCNMITVPEAARRARRDPETIRRWIRSGRLRARKVGTQHVIEEADLAALTGASSMPLPSGWRRTATGDPMPDVLAAMRSSRAGR